MIPPPAQQFMSKRAGSTVVESKGSHSVYVSQPAVARSSKRRRGRHCSLGRRREVEDAEESRGSSWPCRVTSLLRRSSLPMVPGPTRRTGVVIALLQAKGLLVVAVQNPLTTRGRCRPVTRALNHQSHPVVLVGHDYGGTVITQAGRPRRLRHSSTSRRARRTSASRRLMDKGTAARTLSLASFTVDAGFLYLAPDAVLEFLAHDLTATEAAVLAARKSPFGPAHFSIASQTPPGIRGLPGMALPTRIVCLRPPCSARPPNGSMRASSASAPAISHFSRNRTRRRL